MGLTGSNSRMEKIYAHDPRMLTQTPPHYISPDDAGWEVGYWKEVQNHISD